MVVLLITLRRLSANQLRTPLPLRGRIDLALQCRVCIGADGSRTRRVLRRFTTNLEKKRAQVLVRAGLAINRCAVRNAANGRTAERLGFPRQAHLHSTIHAT